MEKQTNRRLIAMTVFLALALVLVLVWRFVIDKEDQAEAEATATPDPEAVSELFPAAIGDVVASLEVRDLQEELVFRAELDSDSLASGATPDPFSLVPTFEWVILESTTESELPFVDSTLISTVVAPLPELRPSRRLSDLDSIGDFGLGEDTRFIISFTTINAGPFELQVGSTNVGSTAYYVQVPGDPNVYLINTFDLDSIIAMLAMPPYTDVDPLALPTLAP